MTTESSIHILSVFEITVSDRVVYVDTSLKNEITWYSILAYLRYEIKFNL